MTDNIPILSCNQYAWRMFLERNNQTWAEHEADALVQMAEVGFRAYEPAVTSPAEVTALAPLLAKAGLSLPSIYVNSILHDEAQIETSIREVLAIVGVAQQVGTRIVVTNPTPIRWGGTENKSDAELARQAVALEQLGAAVAAAGLTLAYHIHGAEMQMGARELHHMMLSTDPAHVAFCLDPDWIVRGTGGSQIALFDVIKLYGDRIVEVHLRQSHDGIWCETFGEGDIDYTRLVDELAERSITPLWVLEQAVEADSPNTMDAAAAHAISVRNANALLAR